MKLEPNALSTVRFWMTAPVQLHLWMVKFRPVHGLQFVDDTQFSCISEQWTKTIQMCQTSAAQRLLASISEQRDLTTAASSRNIASDTECCIFSIHHCQFSFALWQLAYVVHFTHFGWCTIQTCWHKWRCRIHVYSQTTFYSLWIVHNSNFTQVEVQNPCLCFHRDWVIHLVHA